jgi:putative DNA primase/helicase
MPMFEQTRLDQIKDDLKLRTADLAVELLGQPRFRTNTELRYGSKYGLAVAIAGPNSGVWFDHSTGEGDDMIALIQREKQLSFPDAIQYAECFVGRTHALAAPVVDIASSDKAREAMTVWNASVSARGTVVQRYLGSRAVRLPDNADVVIRYHEQRQAFRTVHMMVALVRDIWTDRPIGIHRTHLSGDGKKLGVGLLGAKKGGAIKFTADAAIGNELAIGEGLETTLSFFERGAPACWSVIDAGGLAAFPVIPSIDVLTVAVDNDAAGLKAYESCKDRWIGEGRAVVPVISDVEGEDLNDLVRRKGGTNA